MLPKKRSTAARSTAHGEIPGSVRGVVSNASRPPTETEPGPATASPPPGQANAAGGSGATEREDRRHQRALAREGNGRARDANGQGAGAKAGGRLHQSTSQPSRASRRGRLVIGETVSVGVIGIIVMGLIAGAILGALGAPGWLVGLLVAALTVFLSTVLRRLPRQHRPPAPAQNGPVSHLG
jgi:hypothetical protein